MTKGDLVAGVARAADLQRREAERAVDALFAEIGRALTGGERVAVAGFGTFEVRERAERVGRNPRTGQEITIAASRVPAFRPARGLREAVDR